MILLAWKRFAKTINCRSKKTCPMKTIGVKPFTSCFNFDQTKLKLQTFQPFFLSQHFFQVFIQIPHYADTVSERFFQKISSVCQTPVLSETSEETSFFHKLILTKNQLVRFKDCADFPYIFFRSFHSAVCNHFENSTTPLFSVFFSQFFLYFF